MLPFLRKLQEASVTTPSESIKREPDQEKEYDHLEIACSEMIDAIKKDDSKALCEAFRAAFEICESEPHYEGEHMEGEE